MHLSTVFLAIVGATGALAQTEPDLTAIAAGFPPGTDSNSPVLNITTPPGPYAVQIVADASFPNRTLYVPQSVPEGTNIPIVAWENGMCYKYGTMYADFLSEIASHGYFVIAPGNPHEQTNGSTNRTWQLDSIDWAKKWTAAPFTVDQSKVAVGGHSCGGGETAANLAADTEKKLTTGMILNSGSSKPEDIVKVTVPILWYNGGEPDNFNASEAKYQQFIQAQPQTPIFKAVLQTGHLGSYWSPRGGIYAETAVHWLDWQLKGDAEAHAFFVGVEKSPAAERGWTVASNAVS